MSPALLLGYPEFVLAFVLAVVLVPLGLSGKGQYHAPAWLGEFAAVILSFFPKGYLNWLWRYLNWAGWRTERSFGDYAAIKLVVAGVIFMLSAFLPPLVVIAFAVTAYFMPDLAVVIYVRRRQGEILDSIPQALDLMVLCVDAGLGLDATMQRIATEKSEIASALNDELKILGRDILLGMDRERAYLDLFNRTGVDELRTLGSALNQAGKLGLSIARILRVQSEFIRQRQGQKAEEKALKLPILMSFPLWFCIMPALMLLVLGPSLTVFFRHLQIGVFR